MFSSSVYYVMYYLGRPDLIPLYMGIVSIGALVSMMVLMPIVLKIFKTGPACLDIHSSWGDNLLYVTVFLRKEQSDVPVCGDFRGFKHRLYAERISECARE